MIMNRIEFNVITGEQTTIPLTDEEIAELQSRPVPPPPPSYTAFWDALIASSVYASIRTQSMASLPMNTLATEFIALLGDAKAGRANEAAIQASMSAVFATGTFTEDDAEEFTAALAAGLLDDIYTLGAE
jgi:hypothetical protein